MCKSNIIACFTSNMQLNITLQTIVIRKMLVISTNNFLVHAMAYSLFHIWLNLFWQATIICKIPSIWINYILVYDSKILAGTEVNIQVSRIELIQLIQNMLLNVT